VRERFPALAPIEPAAKWVRIWGILRRFVLRCVACSFDCQGTCISMSRAKSEAAFARAKQLIPGGVNSPARAFGGVGGSPLFIDRAEGAYLYDVDGNRYIDYIGSWGPMILGHSHPRV